MKQVTYQMIQIANIDRIYHWRFTSVPELITHLHKDYNTGNTVRPYGNGRFIITRIKPDSCYIENVESPEETPESQESFKTVLNKWLKDEQDSCNVAGLSVLYPHKVS